tara:strand:+ start:2279 stop:2734 length:456 start_codon:yes stop_codon:yes gene_type:complete
MAFAIKSTLQAVETFLKASGYFQTVYVGEPKQPIKAEKVSAAIFMANVAVTKLTLNSTIERHQVTVRIYRDALAEPQADTEYMLAEVVQKIVEDLAGDYDLGATIRAIDFAGMEGAGLRTDWGYLDIGGSMYRIADISLPLVVDDSATLTQ